MIKTIYINNLGSLNNFSNNDCPFPNGNIIIHGMNGSGKSQISSVLQKVSKLKLANQLGQNYSDNIKNQVAEYLVKRKSREVSDREKVNIKIDEFEFYVDKSSATHNDKFPNLFVFNEDYVSENVGDIVSLPDKSIKIGEKNQERDKLQTEVKDAETALRKVSKAIDELVQKAKTESGFLGQARTANIISVSNYMMETNPGVENKDAKAKLDNLSSPPEAINFHFSIQLPTISFTEEEKKEIIDIFSTTFIEPKLTQEFYATYIKTNKNFFEAGVEIFKTKNDKCPFCLTPKKNDDANILELIKYLDSTYNEKLEKLKIFHNFLKKHLEKIERFLVQWNSHVNNINEKANILALKDKASELQFSKVKYEDYLKLIERKIQNMSLVNSELGINGSIFSYFELIFTKLNEEYLHHTKIIEKVNLSIDKVSSTKRNLGEEIIKHHMFVLWGNNSLRERKLELEEHIKTKTAKYATLAESMSNDRAIDFFNQIIKFLGITKYELNDSSSIILKIAHGYDISNEGFRISTGERKFIALSYFFAEVLASVENSNELKNITIVIDDPIDSSDYQKFYSFISVIENFNNILRAIYRNTEIELGQLIIFTHNALLYERLVNSQTVHHFQLFQENNITKIIVPKKKIALTTFSSYLKKVTNYIKGMENSNNKEIGNYIRRILEIVASIENVDNNKIESLNAASKLNALANHLSHESLERMLDPLPLSHEYVEACIELVEEIRRRIPALYFTIIKKYLDDKEIEVYRNKYSELYLN